ncbi:uncharacterized protein STEHIDRAFT_154317 [Stereum hirsutum FP-91666 SS1]|uniref:uncharacterized protein n=1 Tax=Stereum hirsutum (strain FP-91666) TaxID=721885 RepID=UPI000440AA87|nr:uncharacterized protein STEHIDRAFT_154317 [Stereum hirsutum FP-91666 SS1]EIM90500.1 hypothetical protein STEHIDRAFT_154317 [Stereum hirsutum FP-91666 SS1]
MYISSTLVALLVASAVAAAPFSERRDQLFNVNARASKVGKIAKGASSKSASKVSLSGILDSLGNGLNNVEQGINLFNGFSAVLDQLPTPAATAPALSTPAATMDPTNSTAQNTTGNSSGNTPSKRFALPFGSGLCQIFPEGTVFSPEEQTRFEKECVPHSTVVTSTSAPAVTTPSAPAPTSPSLVDGPERRSSKDGTTTNGLDPAALAALHKLVTRVLDELD